ncbi:MAG: hypothetical protein KKA28_13105 [Planctomycetes bacterium]|nr:hypothetical protein [Planctomycetota bacterium]MCG2685281.1 hypothetical protein [Planctomycetales bacterium]
MAVNPEPFFSDDKNLTGVLTQSASARVPENRDRPLPRQPQAAFRAAGTLAARLAMRQAVGIGTG